MVTTWFTGLIYCVTIWLRATTNRKCKREEVSAQLTLHPREYMCAAELDVLRYNQASHNRVNVGVCICSSSLVLTSSGWSPFCFTITQLWCTLNIWSWWFLINKVSSELLCRVERFSAKDVYASLRDFYKDKKKKKKHDLSPYKHNWHEWQLGSVSTGSVSKYMWANKISTSGHKNWLQRLVFEHTLQTTCLHVILQLLSGSHAAL